MSHAPAPIRSRLTWSESQAPLVRTIAARSLLISGVALVASVVHAVMAENGQRRFMLAYLVAFAFVLSNALGSLFFVFLQHLTRAGWSVLLRRLPETVAANVLVVTLLFIPIAASVVAGYGEIFPWATVREATTQSHDVHPAPTPAGYEHQSASELTAAKRSWLNPTAFVIRWAVLLGFWCAVSRWFHRQSVEQDRSSDVLPTLRMERAAAPVALLFAITVTVGAADLLMSLNPTWYSTIFGVYFFAGGVVGAISIIILMLMLLQFEGAITERAGAEHYHDLGKMLFAFVFFWGYIAFSQYMLLWYANIPESTRWLVIRGASGAQGLSNSWSWVLLALLLGHLLVPFAVLMSRHVKRRRYVLAAAAGWMLFMHWLDLAWMVMPELGPGLSLGVVEIGLGVAMGGVCLGSSLRTLTRYNPVPIGDPRLRESLRFENI